MRLWIVHFQTDNVTGNARTITVLGTSTATAVIQHRSFTPPATPTGFLAPALRQMD
ncbi:MAG TPA: hypothetical protein VH370_25545 [Humisphaera sp.]|jgi:hypothetical protein|nr:hypothetical protein [Humisphaera sp.]